MLKEKKELNLVLLDVQTEAGKRVRKSQWPFCEVVVVFTLVILLRHILADTNLFEKKKIVWF